MESLLREEFKTISVSNNLKKNTSLNTHIVSTYDTVLTDYEITTWKKLVEKSLQNALSGLSELLGHELRLNSLSIEQVPIETISEYIETSDCQSIGTYLSIEGDISGQIMLIHTPEIAFHLIDLLLDLPTGTTTKLGNIERCALEDIGNITGSYFLNTMADNAGLFLMPSPPKVVVDTLSTIVSLPIEFIKKKQKQAILVESTFSADCKKMDGVFIALPTIEFIKAVTVNPVIQ